MGEPGDGNSGVKSSGKSGGGTAGRAAIAVAMLFGFYLIALGMIALLLVLAVLGVMQGVGAATIQLAAVLTLAAVAILVGMVKALRRPKFEPSGLRLTEDRQPHLWGLVRDVAGRIGTRPPDEIWLVPEVNAAVTETAGMLGLRPGRRYMMIGLPLLATMNVDQIRAVLGHELGHYSNADTRLGELSYRGQASVVNTIQQLSGVSLVNTIVRFVFLQYAKLFFLVSHSVSRKQELAADQSAAAIAGRQAMQTALLELPVLSRAWSFYLQQYVQPGLRHGLAPRDVFLSFPRFLEARRSELEEMRRELPDDSTSRWDTHPATSERVTALASAPEAGQLHDPRPATSLVVSIEQAVTQLEQQSINVGDRHQVDWAEYTARTMHAQDRENADGFYRALSRVTGRTPESLETLLSAVAAGHGEELSGRLAQANAPEGSLASAIRVALLDSGQLLVRHRWDGPVDLVLRDGAPFDDDQLVRMMQDPRSVGQARELLQRFGLDPRRMVGGTRSAGVGSADEMIAAVAAVKVDKKTRNVLVTNAGLLAFAPKKISVGGPERQLRQLLEERTPTELAALPNSLWIPYESVVSARLVRKFPLKFELVVADGGRSAVHVIALTTHIEGPGESVDTFAEVLGRLVRRSNANQSEQ